MLYLGQDFWALFELLGDIYKFWGKYHIIKNFTCNLKSYPEFSVHFLFKCELDVYSFGLRLIKDPMMMMFENLEKATHM